MNEPAHPARGAVLARGILIIRLSAIGDVVMATPLVKALRQRYPGAYLAWLVQSEAAPLLSANRVLDEVIIWPRGRWRELWRRGRWIRLAREVSDFVRQLRRRRFDVVIDAQGLLKSGLWARISGARIRIGLGSKEGSARLMTQVIDKPKGSKRIGAEYRHLIGVLGLDGGLFPMDIALTPQDQAFAQELMEREGLQRGYAVVCPFTTRQQKHWVETRWPELARRLRSELGLPVVMLGGSADRAAAEGIASTGLVINMTGKTTLRQGAALIARASLLVGVDTALTHLGTALGVPTVALLGSTCPYLVTDSSRTVVVYKYLACSPCKRRPTCGGAFDCMGRVTVDEVLQHSRRVLNQP
jgi:heptosyltransferase-1